MPVVPEIHSRQGVTLGDECQLAEWTIDHRVSHLHR